MLQQNTDQSGAAIVDDLFQRFLQAGAGFLRDVEQLQAFYTAGWSKLMGE